MSDLTRRQVLRTLGLAAGGTSAAGLSVGAGTGDRATAHANDTPSPTFVLVHGSASNAFFWTPLVQEMALRGHRCLPVDLPGHGLQTTLPEAYQAPQDTAAFAAAPSVLRGLTLDDYAQHVTDVVRRVAEHGPVVLVGHSLGGSTLTRVGNTVPELLDRLVYVSALLCTTVANPLELLGLPEAREGAPQPQATPILPADTVPQGISRYNWRTSDAAQLAGYQQLAMHDATREQMLTAINYVQQPDEAIEPSLADARVDPNTWGTVPRTYVRLTRDQLLTPALADRMITDADKLTGDNPFDVHDIPTTHLGILHHPAELADILANAAR